MKTENNHKDAHFNSGAPYLLALIKPSSVAFGYHQAGGHGDHIKNRFVPDKRSREAEAPVSCRRTCKDGSEDVWPSEVSLWHLHAEILNAREFGLEK